MCQKTFYAIFDRTQTARAVAESYGELNQIATGLGLDREEYCFPIITKKDARKLNKELSNQL